MPDGRFAPSPTGPLHLGNLRTALAAWLFARHRRSAFRLRVEDLDPLASDRRYEDAQLADLAVLGIDWDGPVVRQSERREAHEAAVAALVASGRTYACYCTRREIREAASAPHGEGPEGAYPGTCRRLTARQRAELEAQGRRAALRLDAGGAVVHVVDQLHGELALAVDDFVVLRNDGVVAYNLAVVVDDHFQGIGEVVRADDLLAGTPRQVLLHQLLGLPVPQYAHVPLVLGADGARLAKRSGAITLTQWHESGWSADAVVALLGTSLGLPVVGERLRPAELLEVFAPDRVALTPWRLPAIGAGPNDAA